MPLTVVLLADTHSLHDRIKVPDGDLLIHAGDFTARGSLQELVQFNDFLGTLPHRHKVVVAGNHDFCLQRRPEEARGRITEAVYLEDEVTTVEGLRIYGSPWQPWFGDWAFNLRRGGPLRKKWSLIPEDTDILVTHGPPHGILDKTFRDGDVGCRDLLERVRGVRPALHIFGHIHEAYGQAEQQGTLFVNASVCNLAYQPVQKPVVVTLPALPNRGGGPGDG